MTAAPLMHDIPNAPVQRVMLTLMGSFVAFMVPFDLWRGVWPFNILTPIFAILILLGMGLGAVFIYAGLFSPALEYEMTPRGILVRSKFLRGSSEIFHTVNDITGITIEKDSNTDGPDDWYAVIGVRGRKALRSRPFGSEMTAQSFAKEFTEALGLASK